MVLPFTDFFSKPTQQTIRRPIHTSIAGMSSPVMSNNIGRFSNIYARFWKQFKESPELIAVIDIIVTDILGDSPSFLDLNNELLEKTRFNKAQSFWFNNRVKESLSAILFDMLITGDGYGWVGFADSDEQIRAVKEVLREYSNRLNVKEYNKLLIKAMQDEDLKKPKRFDYVASSSMQIVADALDVKGYVQHSKGLTASFSPREIVHFRYRTMDGRLEGFSPVEAMAKELALLWFVKGNMIAYMENGGRPNLLFSMKNSRPGSEAYQRFEDVLRHYKDPRNSNGNLLGSGDIDVKDLSFGKDRDMEYQNLALWITSNIAYVYGVPITRIPYLIGKSATGGDSGGLAEAGYFRKISIEQDKIELLMNGQVFNPLGFKIRLDRGYKQDEVREAQTYSMNADTVTKLQSIYRMQNKKLSLHKLNELLNIRADDLEDMSPEEMLNGQDKTGLMNQNLLDNMSIDKEPDNRKRASVKRNVANSKINKDVIV